jgi:hypothetical protein
MVKSTSSLSVAALGALALAAASAASAQDNASAGTAAAPPPPTVGNPQLRDFQLQPQRRVVTQPAQPAPVPVVVAPPPPIAGQPQTATTPVRQAQSRPAPRQETPSPQPQTAAPQALPPTIQPAPSPVAPVAQAPQAAPAPAQAEPAAGGFPWLYAVPLAALAVLAFVFLRRRRRAEAQEEIEEAAVVVAAPPPRPDPVPRPWLELALKAERASATDTETIVQFELEISNTGKSPARNLRIDVKMFNAGVEQDREIGAFFRTAGRETTKLNLPGIGPDSTGVIRGEVAMPRDEMRAVVLDDKYLFIPVIAVNALYDWGEGRSGQTSKSYVVGRELQQPSEKMGAFRIDLGPRIWRTIGQRQHTLAKRV